MRRSRLLLVALLSLAVALAPALGMAAAGSGGSYGSRGSRTYMAPPSTRTSPYGAAPMQRSLTPRQAPSYGAPNYGGGYGYRSHSPFMSGLLGGLIGAGLGGLLFGHGMFYGLGGMGSFIGLLIQIFLVVWVVRWLFRRLLGQPAYSPGNGYARTGAPPDAAPFGGGGGGAPGRPLEIAPADYQAFEQLLYAVQAAWSAHDLNRLQQLATPEMVGVFGEQMAEQASQGVRNIVSDVRLEQGDLAEAWSEGGRDYATVAMRFAMHDATRDNAGRIVDGSVTEWVSTVEYWTFMRAPGGRWVLSAIQQSR